MDAEQKRRLMARFRSKDTKPEMLVRRELHRRGYRFRLHRRDLPGKPDIVLPRHAIAIFVHGCFWHQHDGCKIARVPKTRTEFWKMKFDGNRLRDHVAAERLAALGWRVIVLWECDVVNDRLGDVLDIAGLR